MPEVRVTAERAREFLVARQHLDRRLPASRLTEAVGGAGLQDSPPGGAGLSLVARMTGLTPVAYDRALWSTKSLALVWGPRAARYVIRAGDFAVFTRGAAPVGEAETRAFAGTIGSRSAAAAGLGCDAAVDRIAVAIRRSLRGRALSRHHLGGAVKRLLPAPLAPYCRSCDARHVTVLMLRAGALRAGVVHAGPGDGADMTFRLASEWWPRPVVAVAPAAARIELLRRFLAAHGPATPERFAKCLGLGPGHVRAAWTVVAPELAEVRVDSIPGWMRRRDLPALRAARPPGGVRWLPAFDSLLAGDRGVLVPDPARQRQVWRVIDRPGVLMVDGRVAGVWKTRKRGTRLEILLGAFGRLPAAVRRAVESAAVDLGPWRGATEVEVTLV